MKHQAGTEMLEGSTNVTKQDASDIIKQDDSGTLEGTSDTTKQDDSGTLEGTSDTIKQDDSGTLEGTSDTIKQDDSGTLEGTSDTMKQDDSGTLEGTSDTIKQDDSETLEGTSDTIKQDDSGKLEGTSDTMKQDNFGTLEGTPDIVNQHDSRRLIEGTPDTTKQEVIARIGDSSDAMKQEASGILRGTDTRSASRRRKGRSRSSAKVSVGERIEEADDVELGIYEDSGEGDGLSNFDDEQEQDLDDDHTEEELPMGIDVSIATRPSGIRYRDVDDVMDNVRDSVTIDAYPSAGTRANVNTPASAYYDTDWSDFKGVAMGPKDDRSTTRQNTTASLQDAMFRRAMTLMAQRCATRSGGKRPVHGNTIGTDPTTGRQTPLLSFKDIPIGHQASQYFFVYQKRPVPMPPLKAWRGFNGSVYFEPIHVKKAAVELQETPSGNAQRSKPISRDTVRSSRDAVRSSRHHPKNGSSAPSSRNASRQMSILDKRSVFSTQDRELLKEDVNWIVGMESTGSLCLARDKVPDSRGYDRTRLHRGSMAHRMYVEQQEVLRKSAFRERVHYAGKVAASPPYSNHSRPTTHHSMCSRITTNTPEMSSTYAAMEKLPPLQPPWDTRSTLSISSRATSNTVLRADSRNQQVLATGS